jgi:hypothetical protein
VPFGNAGNRYIPAASVVAGRFSPVSLLTASTTTPGTAPTILVSNPPVNGSCGHLRDGRKDAEGGRRERKSEDSSVAKGGSHSQQLHSLASTVLVEIVKTLDRQPVQI